MITEGEWLKSLNRYPFEGQSLPSASFNLIQQVGRLIRSHQCWGEVIIYDKRLLTKKLRRAIVKCVTGISHRAAGRSRGYSKKAKQNRRVADAAKRISGAVGGAYRWGDKSMDYTKIIKEVGRGKNHARDLDLVTARALYTRMLNGEVDDLELGAILIALRIKGEGEAEMQGLL